ncbi:AAC(3) family N-acetyltransferase [Vibrio metoecus]|uniref:Aminoglycoside N(3)-acetyltransferase n=1 Tax=Vibrio metoecus TaxID=1481663 RepID=A0A271VNZ2_VIBMT|nr:AAC(3) family N-acetyltransferase [Vibrio metoecus]KQB09443.1 hypothetical protein XV94_09755 [Vibrio metoecus]PAR19736.1 hypothetical protein CGU03_15430 [Vibrio metoecus]PAR23753.1 hypothetical protein CGU02_13185 [Vibrio metoecus]PAR27111.1 hypothetical protein CGU00_15305 [Vibrio metoecus]PAR35692.1 hypothetical protein CGT97_09995 [Vibrio metoecus]
MYLEKQKELIKELEAVAAKKLFVHSGSLKTRHLVKKSKDRQEILSQHVALLSSLVEENGLFIPTFSYQFPKTRLFDVKNTPSEIGRISEYFRANIADWRTPDPMFSVCGTGPEPRCSRSQVSPFGEHSFFADLVKNEGHLLFYGAGIESITIMHYAEFLSDVSYRYWKEFDGHLIDGDTRTELNFTAHFRPMGRHLDYQWDKIESDLINVGILERYNSNVFGMNAKALVDFWCQKMSEDPLYLLDKESRIWVEPMLDSLGRAFTKEDFE